MSVLRSLLCTNNDKNEEKSIVMTEREILTELIKLYSNLSCLWDFKSEDYKSKVKKIHAWTLLNEVHQKLEPESTIQQTKKKVDHMKSAYQREVKKVKASKQTGSAADKVHKPILWYYNLMSFLDKETEQCISIETLSSDEESQQIQQYKVRRKKIGNLILKQNNHKFIETTQELPQQNNKNQNSFGLYLGEQLEEVNKVQRQIAEKLISEIIFYARTGKLKCDSKIETPKSHTSFSSKKYQCSQALLTHITNPCISPVFVRLSPSPPQFDLSNSPDLLKP